MGFLIDPFCKCQQQRKGHSREQGSQGEQVVWADMKNIAFQINLAIYYDAKGNRWLHYFAVFCRIMLALGFIPSGVVKIMGERFASGLSYFLCWDYDRIKYILPFEQVKADGCPVALNACLVEYEKAKDR